MKNTKRALKGNNKFKELRKKLKDKMTPAEHKLWTHLKNKSFKSLKFRRQHGIANFIVDFYCPQKKLIIEIDGDIHGNHEVKIKDKQREDFLINLGLQIIRYNNDDVLNNVEGV